MDAEITPEPTPDERRALLAALEEALERRDGEPSGWRRAALAAEDDYDATAPPRSSRGATRA
jgi:hypothetical protein